MRDKKKDETDWPDQERDNELRRINTFSRCFSLSNSHIVNYDRIKYSHSNNGSNSILHQWETNSHHFLSVFSFSIFAYFGDEIFLKWITVISEKSWTVLLLSLREQYFSVVKVNAEQEEFLLYRIEWERPLQHLFVHWSYPIKTKAIEESALNMVKIRLSRSCFKCLLHLDYDSLPLIYLSFFPTESIVKQSLFCRKMSMK